MLGILQSLSHKTAIANAKNALKCAEICLKDDIVGFEQKETAKVHAIASLDRESAINNIPGIMIAYQSSIGSPQFSNARLSYLAHEKTKYYISQKSDPEKYFIGAVSAAYFGMLSTPNNTSGREDVWIKLITLIDVPDMKKAFDALDSGMVESKG